MLQAKNLTCERKYRILFENLSFTLNSGEVLRVEGPNGCGKTTLLRILCGLLKDHSGEVRRDDDDALLYLGHAPGVKDHLSAEENLTWLARLGQEEDVGRDEILSALSRVGLTGFEDMACGSLSAGQKKRVNLARLFVLKARLWILDEPFSAIDTDGVAALRERMIGHVEEGGMLVITSHQQVDFGADSKRIRLGAP